MLNILNFTLLLYKKQVAKAPLHNFYTRSRDVSFINNFTLRTLCEIINIV